MLTMAYMYIYKQDMLIEASLPNTFIYTYLDESTFRTNTHIYLLAAILHEGP